MQTTRSQQASDANRLCRLEFCKINSLTQAKKSPGTKSRSDASNLVSDFDLGILVEEVTNILYTGQKALPTADRSVTDPSSHSNDMEPNTRSKTSPATSLVVRIEQSHPWHVRSLPGAWRRIVMNLLGNAIKWTKSGLIEVSLSRARHQSDPHSLLAHLTVTDTGSGIATDFLRHKLFTPFAQEDPLAEGVGLGLSIVRQLVASLDGHLNVRSELGLGTQVDVYIPVQHLEATSSQKSAAGLESANFSDHPAAPLHACLVAFNGYPDLKETPTGMLTVEAKRKLSIQSTLADIFMSHFGWTVSLAESLDKAKGDIAVVEESTLATVGEDARPMNGGPKLFLVLANEPPGKHQPPNTVWMTQPYVDSPLFLNGPSTHYS